MPAYKKFVVLGLLFSSILHYAEAAPAPAKKPVAKAPQRAATAAPISAEAIPLLNQGITAMNQNHYPQAEQAFKQALLKMGPHDANLIVAYSRLSFLYYRQDQYPLAYQYGKKAEPLIAKEHGANSVNLAEHLYLLATTCHFLNDNAQAEAIYRRALAIYEAPANAQKPRSNYIWALYNLGTLLSNKGQHENALALYQKGLALKRSNEQPGKAVGQLLENMGNTYQNLDQLDAAARHYQRALDVYEKALGADSEQAKRVYFKLSNLQGGSAVTGNPDATQPRYSGQALEAGKKAYNIDQNYPEAVRQFKLALEQVRQFNPNEVQFIAFLQGVIGKAIYYAESEEPAETYLQAALVYHEKQPKPNADELLSLHSFLGLVYNRKGEYELAEKHFNYVFAHTKDKNKFYYSLLPTVGDNLCHQGNFGEAKPLYEQALAYFQQESTPDEVRIKRIQHQLAMLDKMFQSQSQGLAQYFNHSVSGLRRWRDGDAPIQILIQNNPALPGWSDQYPQLVRQAFQAWQAALNSQIQFEFTDNPDKTDVVVNWTDQVIQSTDVDAQVGVHKLGTTRGFFLSSEIVISIAKNGKLRPATDIYATALHEAGHMLGLAHSGNLTDIMAEMDNYSHSGKDWPALSSRDIQAVQILYRQQPAITDPLGITLAEYQKFNALSKEGLEALQGHGYRRAARLLGEAREFYMGDPYINFYYGLSVFNTGDYSEAKDIFENLVMPESAKVFSVDSQLGLVYVELGHKYNKWGKKNKLLSNEFYEKGVHHLQVALQNSELTLQQREYFLEKLRQGQLRQKPEPIIQYDIKFPLAGRFY